MDWRFVKDFEMERREGSVIGEIRSVLAIAEVSFHAILMDLLAVWEAGFHVLIWL